MKHSTKTKFKRVRSTLVMSTIIVWLFAINNNAQEVINNVQINACALDANSNLLITGSIEVNGLIVSGVARYTSSGILDTTLNSDGYAFTSVGSRVESNGITVQANGSIVTAGFAIVNNLTQAVLARYTSSGALDTTFGSSGIVTTQIGNGCSAAAVAIQTTGQIDIVGVDIQSGVSQFLIAQYNSSDGSLDTAFNSGGAIPGIVTSAIGNRANANALAIQSNGQIVAAGMAVINGPAQFCVARYNTDGSSDTSFGTNGVVTTAVGTNDQIFAVTLDSSGNIVVAGSSNGAVALARYTTAGVLDTSFNSSGPNPGTLTTSVGSNSQANAILIDADGNIVIGGFSDSNMLIARYTTEGALDTTFGANATGLVTISIENTNSCTSLVLQGSDIIAAGSANADTLIIRLTSAGIIDTTWGTNGLINQPGNANLFTTIWEQETPGTNGGTFTSSLWETRILNQVTQINNTVTLSDNQFTLNPGIYTISAVAPAYEVDNHQARLQDVTNDITILYGTSAYSPNSGGSMTTSLINGQFAVSTPTAFEIQHMCATTQASDGFGIATGFGNEVYTTIKITNNFSF